MNTPLTNNYAFSRRHAPGGGIIVSPLVRPEVVAAQKRADARRQRAAAAVARRDCSHAISTTGIVLHSANLRSTAFLDFQTAKAAVKRFYAKLVEVRDDRRAYNAFIESHFA